MLADDANACTENSSSFPSLHERESYVPEIAKESAGQASGGGQKSSLLRVSSFVFELIQ
jgi:hypothetical protein